MPYQPIDIDLMRDSLMTVDQIKEKLEPTEHLAQYEFDTDPESSNHVQFHFPENWQAEIKEKDVPETTVSGAYVTIDNNDFALTKGAVLKATSSIGLQQTYVLDTPGNLIEPNVNYWYKHGANGKRTMKMLAKNQVGLAFVRGTITPFSNEALIDAAIDGIQEKYDTTDVLFDYKFDHDLDKTHLRLILPTRTHDVTSERTAVAGNDPWSLGLEIKNSLTGTGSLEIGGYLFAYWCTNGCTMNHVGSGKYRRKPSLSPEDAYEWARYSVDEVLGDLEHEFDVIDSLTQISLEKELTDTLDNTFEKFKIPAETREAVMENLAESQDLSAYGMLNSLTAVANDPTLSPSMVSTLLSAGGKFTKAIHEDRCEHCHKF